MARVAHLFRQMYRHENLIILIWSPQNFYLIGLFPAVIDTAVRNTSRQKTSDISRCASSTSWIAINHSAMAGIPGRTIFWTGLAGFGVTVGAISAAHWSKGPRTSSDAGVLRALPLNLIGITAHYASSIPIPEQLRDGIFKSYCSIVGCDVNEVNGDLRSFKSLSKFFSRSLRAEVRPIDNKATLVVPCDGTVMELGPVGAYGTIQVKNVKYRIRELVGADEREPLALSSVAVADRKESGSRLWYIVVHIGPGQCHRFASPANWRITKRRHVQGYLLWMNPDVAGLYTENERVAMVGDWEYGLFALTAVGAAGRGSIVSEPDEETFWPRLRPKLGEISTTAYFVPKKVEPGQSLGGFKLGSAIVLVFEAPERSFQFHVKKGDEVRLGQNLATIQGNGGFTLKGRTKPDDFGKTVPERSTRARFRRAW